MKIKFKNKNNKFYKLKTLKPFLRIINIINNKIKVKITIKINIILIKKMKIMKIIIIIILSKRK
jgi:hypothetical protein